MVTNQSIYNIDNKKITRKTLMCKISGICISSSGSEFVILVPDEYDYRYASYDRRDYII